MYNASVKGAKHNESRSATGQWAGGLLLSPGGLLGEM